MMSIFSDLVEEVMEIFMDDFSVYGSSFEDCLKNLEIVLQRCQDKNIALNWEKFHFMVTKGIVLGQARDLCCWIGSRPSKDCYYKNYHVTYNSEGHKKLLGTCWILQKIH